MDAYQVTGRLTRDPELRSVPDGGIFCKIRLAVDRMGRRDATAYIDITSASPPRRPPRCSGRWASSAARSPSRMAFRA